MRVYRPSGNTPTAGAKRAFTLIELLVVIAIIAILAAILFPVFAQAREKARGITCLSNLKQIGTGVMMYVQDYDENYPMMQWGVGDYHFTWPAMIHPYIKNDATYVNPTSGLTQAWGSSGIFKCPSFPDRNQSMNYGAHNDLFVDNWNWGTNPSVSMAALDAPADKVVIMEKGRTDAFWGWNQFATWQWDWADSVMDGRTYNPAKDNMNIALQPGKGDCDGVPTSASDGEATWAGCGMLPRFRHTGTANMIFGDGHAKAMSRGQVKFYKNIYIPVGQAATWGGEGWYPY